MSGEGYDETQMMLLDMAASGRARLKIDSLYGDILDGYLNPERVQYDPAFAEEMSRLHPDWIFSDAERDRHKYNSNRNYARYDGKTFGQIHMDLYRVYKECPEHSDPAYGGGSFIGMVEKFAADDFYNMHYVARAYLANTMTDGPLLDPIDAVAERAEAQAPRL